MPIYNGTQKVSMSGIDKVYVGTTLVYQKQASEVTITYSTCVYNNLCPVTKTVQPGYVLTSADLPTLTGSTAWSTDHWTLSNDPTDAGSAVSAGYVVTQNITLYAVWKGNISITRTNVYQRSTASGSSRASVSRTLCRTSDGGEVSVTVQGPSGGSGTWRNVAMMFGAVLTNVYSIKPFAIEWTPTQSSVVWQTGSTSSTSTSSNLYPKLVAQTRYGTTLVPVTETVSGSKRKLVVDSSYSSYFNNDEVRVRVGYGYNSNSYVAKYTKGDIRSDAISNYILKTPSGNWTENIYLRTLA